MRSIELRSNEDWRVTLTLVLHAWKSPAMFLRLAPTLVHDCLSLTIKPRWQRQVVPLQLLTSIGPVSITELSEAKRLRGRGLGLGNGALLLLMLLHSGNWKVASLIGLLGTETVTWGDGGGSWSTADCTRSGSGRLDKSSTLPGCSQITRGCWDTEPPDRRGARSAKQKKNISSDCQHFLYQDNRGRNCCVDIDGSREERMIGLIGSYVKILSSRMQQYHRGTWINDDRGFTTTVRQQTVITLARVSPRFITTIDYTQIMLHNGNSPKCVETVTSHIRFNATKCTMQGNAVRTRRERHCWVMIALKFITGEPSPRTFDLCGHYERVFLRTCNFCLDKKCFSHSLAPISRVND